MLESALNLLTICQNEVKREKLKEAVQRHRARAGELREQIREARGAAAENKHYVESECLFSIAV